MSSWTFFFISLFSRTPFDDVRRIQDCRRAVTAVFTARRRSRPGHLGADDIPLARIKLAVERTTRNAQSRSSVSRTTVHCPHSYIRRYSVRIIIIIIIILRASLLTILRRSLLANLRLRRRARNGSRQIRRERRRRRRSTAIRRHLPSNHHGQRYKPTLSGGKATFCSRFAIRSAPPLLRWWFDFLPPSLLLLSADQTSREVAREFLSRRKE